MAGLGRIEKPDPHARPGGQEASSLTSWRLQAPVLFVGFPEARVSQWVSPDRRASNRRFTRVLVHLWPREVPESEQSRRDASARECCSNRGQTRPTCGTWLAEWFLKPDYHTASVQFFGE